MSFLNHFIKSSTDAFKKHLPSEAECKTIDSDFKASVQNLSATGAYIITRNPLSIGQEIAMTIKFPKNREAIKRTGIIVKITSEGVEVEFTICFYK